MPIDAKNIKKMIVNGKTVEYFPKLKRFTITGKNLEGQAGSISMVFDRLAINEQKEFSGEVYSGNDQITTEADKISKSDYQILVNIIQKLY